MPGSGDLESVLNLGFRADASVSLGQGRGKGDARRLREPGPVVSLGTRCCGGES